MVSPMPMYAKSRVGMFLTYTAPPLFFFCGSDVFRQIGLATFKKRTDRHQRTLVPPRKWNTHHPFHRKSVNSFPCLRYREALQTNLSGWLPRWRFARRKHHQIFPRRASRAAKRHKPLGYGTPNKPLGSGALRAPQHHAKP